MVDTLVIAATGPLIETDHILGVIVRNSQQVAEFPLAGLFVTHLESDLHINAGIAVESDKVDLFFTLLANKDFRIEGVEMKINGILDEFMDVARQGKTQIAIAEPQVLEIVFVAQLELAEPGDVDTRHTVDEKGIAKGFQVVDDLQRGYIDTLGLEITADVVGREKVADIVGDIIDQRFQKRDITDALSLHDIFQQDGGIDVAEILKTDVGVQRQIRQIGQAPESEVVAQGFFSSV